MMMISRLGGPSPIRPVSELMHPNAGFAPQSNLLPGREQLAQPQLDVQQPPRSFAQLGQAPLRPFLYSSY